MSEGGFQKITADGVIGVSGKPIRLFGYTQLSAATGSGLVIFYNGSSASGTELFRRSGTANGTITVDFGASGMFFPAGLYLDIDADVTNVTANYVQVQS